METQQPLTIRYDGVHCNLAIEQYAGDVVILRISGMDIGEFGEAPMLALGKLISGKDSVQLFIDARGVSGASIEVSGEWARWLRDHKAQLQDVSMLTGSRFIAVTADFVRRFSDLEGIMRIYTDATSFDMAIAEAMGS